MNVLQLISSTGYYGAENMVVTLAGGLWRMGCRTVVGVFRDSRCAHLEVADHALERGLPVEVVPCHGRWDGQAAARIRKFLDVERIDVLHCHGYKANAIGWAAVWPRHAALVATCHNWPDRKLKMRWYAKLDRFLLRRFDAVAAASEPVAETLRKSGIRGASAMPNGVDTARFQNAQPTIRHLLPPDGEPVIGFVGRMAPEKGGAYLLRSVRQVLTAWPQAVFVFVGEGPSRPEWEALASQLGIARNVVFTGVREDMPGVYASLDLLVLPSLAEATPMCLLECLSATRPVIATNVGSVPKVVIPGITGLLVEPADARALAGSVLRLLGNPVLAQTLAEQGRAHVASHFSADAAASAYAALYEKAISHRTRPS